METFSALLAICAGNSPDPGEFPHKGQWREALMFSLICVWINGWVNNRKAGNLRGYRIHYDVIVMLFRDDDRMIANDIVKRVCKWDFMIRVFIANNECNKMISINMECII